MEDNKKLLLLDVYAGKEMPYYYVGGENLTNAGALLADESPIRHSRVFCTRWNGLDKASGLIDAVDDEEYSGGLINLLQDSMSFVSRNTKKAWRKTGNGRIEMPDYPDTAVLEGVVNALIHRDYMELGSEVHIDMFDDRMEIYSPGGMPDGRKVQDLDLRNVSSRRRNPIIADIFNRLKYMDRRGSGFKKILDSYEFQEHYTEEMKPEFRSSNSEFWLIFKNLNYEAKDVEFVLTTERADTKRSYLIPNGQDMDKMIIDFCREPKSVMEIMDNFKFKSRTSFKRNYLQKMLAEGTLKMTIPDKPSSKNQKYYS